jgi:hypothetical protein
MIRRILRFMLIRKNSNAIEKLAKTNPDVKKSLFSLHKSGNDLNEAIKKHEDKYGKYFK